MLPKNIRRPTAASRAAVSIIRGAKPSWQRANEINIWTGNRQFQAPKVKFLSTAEAAALDDRTACCRAYIGCPICSLKFEFSFLNGNLMVPAGHQIIFGRVVTTLSEPGFTALESAECGGR